MLKNILFFSPISAESTSVGLWKKVKMEINFFETKGYKVKFIDLSKDNAFIKRSPFYRFSEWNVNSEVLNSTDIIYIRNDFVSFNMIKLMKNAKGINPKIKIFLEVPTYPYDGEFQYTVKNFSLLINDRYYRRKLKYYVDKIITFSDDDVIFDIPTIRISNMIDFKEIKVNSASSIDQKVINCISVATYSRWHGYDRMIEGMYKYYSNPSNERHVIYHVVGGGELESYKNLSEKYNLQGKIYFYGPLDGAELDEIYNKADVALDSMGRHRSGVSYNSSLKGKEYGAKGLPIISGVSTELDFDNAYKYYLRIPADDSAVDIEKIIEFYDRIYEEEGKNDVVNNISRYTKKKFDVMSVLNEVLIHF